MGLPLCARLAAPCDWARRCHKKRAFTSLEFGTWPLPPRADGKDFKAWLAGVRSAQIRRAALQIHWRSCCDAAFPRGQWDYSLRWSSVRFTEFDTQPLPLLPKMRATKRMQ